MNKAILIALLIFFLVIGFFSVHGVLAYTLEVPIGTTTEVSDLPEYISVVYRFAVGIISLLAVLLIIYGGLTWVTAAGNETRIGDAKATIFAAIIGLVIALTSYTLLNTINPNLVNLRLSIPSLTSVATTTGTTGTATSGDYGTGTCEPCPDGSGCGVSDLIAAGFSQEGAEQMAQICRPESTCGNPVPSETDFCIENLSQADQDLANAGSGDQISKSTRLQYSTSMGIFQIHLPVESTVVSGQSEPCLNAFTNYSPGPVFGDHCQILPEKQALYDACRSTLLNDKDLNLQIALSKYNSGGLSHWRYSAEKVCGFSL